MQKIIFANWKCYKSASESREWIVEVGAFLNQNDPFRLVVCPPFTYLYEIGQMIADGGYPMELGAQSVSSYEDGAYTGEVSAKMLSCVGVKWSLIGHSERRAYFFEKNSDIEEKVLKCRAHGIEPVALVRSEEDVIPDQVSYFAWEPVSAIGTGNAIDPAEAEREIIKLKDNRALHGMYGGSVKVENVGAYFACAGIEGAVVGSASLDPHKFIQLLNALR